MMILVMFVTKLPFVKAAENLLVNWNANQIASRIYTRTGVKYTTFLFHITTSNLNKT